MLTTMSAANAEENSSKMTDDKKQTVPEATSSRPASPTSGGSPRIFPTLILPDGEVAGPMTPAKKAPQEMDIVQVEEELFRMMMIPEDFLTPDEEDVLEEFCGDIARIRRLNDRDATREYAVKFLMARKFNPSRAFNLYQRYKLVRHKYDMDKLSPTEDPLFSELATGKFTFLEMKEEGEAIGVFTGAVHNQKVDNKLLIQGLLFNIDEALRGFATVACGITLLINLKGVKPNKSDRMLAETILDLLQDQYPARIKRVFVVDAPWYMRHLFRFIVPFMKPKMRERVFLVKGNELLNYFPPGALPISLGGTRLLNHSTWLTKSINHYMYIKGSRVYAGKGSQFKRRLLPDPPNNPMQPPRRSLVPHQQDYILKMRSPSLPGPGAEQGSANAVSNLLNPGQDFVSYLRALHTMNGLTLEDITALLDPRDRKDLFEEFSEIQAAPLRGCFVSTKLPCNAPKNRFADIFCMEETRVKLSPIYLPSGEQADGSDYIHGNFVGGIHQPKSYILCQGPMESTVGDFWRMVWEQRVAVVVMAANLMENSISQCFQYWPEADSVVRIAGFTLRVTDLMETADWTRRIISFRRAGAPAGRKVTHYHLTQWNDKGSLKSTLPMIQVMLDMHRMNDIAENAVSTRHTMRKMVRSLPDAEALDHTDESNPNSDIYPPILVHCGTGVGRSASFVAADICCMAIMQGTVDIAGTVCFLRTQRAQSIQTFAHYKFVYQAIVEYGHLMQQADSENGLFDTLLRDMPASHLQAWVEKEPPQTTAAEGDSSHGRLTTSLSASPASTVSGTGVEDGEVAIECRVRD